MNTTKEHRFNQIIDNPKHAELSSDSHLEDLINAIVHGDVATAKFLISKGINVNGGNYRGETPLHFAAMMGRDEIAELLLENGANVHAHDKGGRIPMFWAVTNNSKDMIILLEKHGSPMSLQVEKPKTDSHKEETT